MTNIAPGWYKDPADPSTQRYWDGEGWLGDPLPVDAQPPAGPPPVPKVGLAGGGHPSGQTPNLGGATARPGAGRGAPTGVGTGGLPGPGDGGTSPPVPPGSPAGRPYPRFLPVPPRPHGLPLATPGARFLARMVDIAIVVALNVVVNGWFAYQWWRTVEPTLETRWRTGAVDSAVMPERAYWLLYTIMFVGLALWFAYEVPAVASTGQTLGKRVLGITVMRLESQEPLGFRRSMRRWNRMGMPVLLWPCCGVGFVLQFVDNLFVAIDRPLQQAIHDKAALTVVVKTSRHRRERKLDRKQSTRDRAGSTTHAPDGDQHESSHPR